MALIASIALVAASVSCAPAAAAPRGIFTLFYDCPVTVPTANLCQVGQTTSGEFTIGATKVPINRTITLQGATLPTEEEAVFQLAPAADGNSMTKTELSVPGGLRGFIACEEIKGSGGMENLARSSCQAVTASPTSTAVTATTELAASAQHRPVLNLGALISANGTALTLPIKIHLKNPFLGANCYIGSDVHPIVLHLTTGATAPAPPNRSISGSIGLVEFKTEEEQPFLRLNKNSLVDNTYSAPRAEGCGGVFSPLITTIVNTKLKLPSPAGANTAILDGALNTATVEGVKLSETFP